MAITKQQHLTEVFFCFCRLTRKPFVAAVVVVVVAVVVVTSLVSQVN
jgi:hypothetical protein